MKPAYVILCLCAFSIFYTPQLQAQKQKPLTVREVFDFNIGDVFWYVRGYPPYSSDYYHYNRYSRRELIGKWYSSDSSTLYYKWQLGTDTTAAINDTATETYSHLDSIASYSYRSDSTYHKRSNDGHLLLSLRNTSDTSSYYNRPSLKLDINGTQYYPDYGTFEVIYVKGLGITYMASLGNEDPSDDWIYRLTYYKKGNEEWGKPGAVKEVSAPSANKLYVYPNPVSMHSELHLGNLSTGNAKVTIYDMQGRAVYAVSGYMSGVFTIALSDAFSQHSGCYVVEAVTPDAVFRQKISISQK